MAIPSCTPELGPVPETPDQRLTRPGGSGPRPDRTGRCAKSLTAGEAPEEDDVNTPADSTSRREHPHDLNLSSLSACCER